MKRLALVVVVALLTGCTGTPLGETMKALGCAAGAMGAGLQGYPGGRCGEVENAEQQAQRDQIRRDALLAQQLQAIRDEQARAAAAAARPTTCINMGGGMITCR